jgi:translation initiation factor IF-1
MNVLLGTNIIIHREAGKVSGKSRKQYTVMVQNDTVVSRNSALIF